MKAARLLSLFAPLAVLVACGTAPDDSGPTSQPTAQARQGLGLEIEACTYASCEVGEVVRTEQSLIDLGCGAGTLLVSYTAASLSPWNAGPQVPLTGYFALCPESAGLSASCSYCLTPAPPGYVWVEWLSEEIRPCPSGCLGGRLPPSYP